MKKRIFKILGIFIISSLPVSFAFATNKDFEGVVVSNKDLTKTTERNDGLIKTTNEVKSIETGKIYTIGLKNCDEFSKYGLKTIYSLILKAMEKDFSSKNKNNVEDIFKDVNVGSYFGGEKYVSFKVMLDEGYKNKVEKYFEDVLNINDVEKFRKNLKEIVKTQLVEKDYKEICKKYLENVEKKLESEEKRKNIFSNNFPFLNGFTDRFNIGDEIFDNDYIKEADNERNNIILNKIKDEISKCDGDKINKAIDCIKYINRSGDFKSQNVEVKQYVTNQ